MILIDNTVLSNFALIHHPDSIQHAFLEDVGTTEQVFHELERGVQLGRLPEYPWTWLQRFHLTEAEAVRFHQFVKHLGEGEASCLAVAVHRAYIKSRRMIKMPENGRYNSPSRILEHLVF